jgi:hypothetical protein
MNITEVRAKYKVYDTEWTDHVLSFLAEDEKHNGNPTVDGLRRLAAIFIGEIFSSQSEVLQCPTLENNNRAVVKHTIQVATHDGSHTFDGVADVCNLNTDPAYAKFPTSMAETRAEGRALRRALKLKKVVAAEEMSNVATQDGEGELEYISQGQMTILDTLCSKGRGCDINVMKLVNNDGVEYKTLSKVPKSIAAGLIQKLSTFQQDLSLIPSDLKGYSPDWRKV